MNPLAKGKQFCSLFPHDFADRILPEEAEIIDLKVYRVCLSGKIDRESFRSTYEDHYYLKRPEEVDLDDPSTYSTSCCEKARDIRNSLKMFMKRNHPKAIVAAGNTGKTDGLVLQECKKKELKKGKRNHSHVDWWIYRDHDVSYHFNDCTSLVMNIKEVKNDENT